MMKLKWKQTVAVLLAVLLCIAAIPVVNVFAADAVTTTLGHATPVNSADLTQYNLKGTTVTAAKNLTQIGVKVDTGTFTIPAEPTGATYTGGYDKDGAFVAAFSATQEYRYASFQGGVTTEAAGNWADSVIFQKESEDIAQNVTLEANTVELKDSANNELKVFDGHYYGFKEQAAVNYADAYTATKQTTFNGMTGYLVTITSKEEHNTIYKMFNNKKGWAGGARLTAATGLDDNTAPTLADQRQGNWYWINGPEAETMFFEGHSFAQNGKEIGYNNWTRSNNSTEPNGGIGQNVGDTPWQAKLNENAMQYGYGDAGTWNDLSAILKKTSPDTGEQWDQEKEIEGYYIEYSEYTNKTTGQENKMTTPPTTSTQKVTLDAYKFVRDHVSEGNYEQPYTEQTDINNTNKTKVLDGETKYNNLTDEEKATIKTLLKNKEYTDLLDEAKAQKFQEENKATLDATTVDNTNVDNVTDMANEFKNLTDGIKNSVTGKALTPKVETLSSYAEWYNKHKTVLEKTTDQLSKDDLQPLLTAKAEFDALPAEQQALISDANKARLDAAVEANNWQTKHKEIIDKKTVTSADKDAIDAAITEYDALSEEAKKLVDPLVKTNLDNKQKASEMQKNNPVVDKPRADLTHEDMPDLAKAKQDFDALTQEQQDLVPEEVKEKLNDYIAADKWNNDHADIIGKTPVTAEDKAAIDAALADYEQLPNKNLVDPSVIGKLQDKQAAADFQQKHDEIIKKDSNTVTKDDFDTIKDALNDFNGLTDGAKEQVPAEVEKKLLDDLADSFIKNYVTGEDGTIYPDVTKDNYRQILSGEPRWDDMTQKEKDAVNEKLVAATGKTYPEYLELAKSLLEQAEQFIQDHVTQDNDLIKDVTENNFHTILGGEDTWNQLNPVVQGIINDLLVERGSQTYPELLAAAKRFLNRPVATGDTTNLLIFALPCAAALTTAILLLCKRRKTAE